MTVNYFNLDLVNMNAYIKFVVNLSVCSQDIKWECNSSINQGSQLGYKSAKNDA